MIERVQRGGLKVAGLLDDFIVNEVLPGLGIEVDSFWQSFETIIREFSQRNKDLLKKRACFQAAIDDWHSKNPGPVTDKEAYRDFLYEIGYLLPPIDDFTINTQNVDEEIAVQAGPQLVVPVNNARYAVNACNARWGSLYDALYGTDAIMPLSESKGGYDIKRGEKVIAFVKSFLDQVMPLAKGTYDQIQSFKIVDDELKCLLKDGSFTSLQDSKHWLGYVGSKSQPVSLLFCQNDLHIDIHIDPAGNIGATDPASIQDVILEAAVTTIQDCEDSVAAVDTADKVGVYRNWLGLMKGDLSASFSKHGQTKIRKMNPDKDFISKNGSSFKLPGRSLMLVRNVGLLMTSDAIIDANGEPVPEGIMDAVVTVLAGMHDINNDTRLKNSHCGNVYIVKPKLHGPEEVHFTCELFCAMEEAFDLVSNTIKLGIMDEEKRTTVNLKQCIYEARERLIFINTGFLDRTGDEIHTAMHAGPFVAKKHMKSQLCIKSYESWNVEIGLRAGLAGKAQIGKGMWVMPDNMADMIKQKVVHPRAGASTAWVPSPTAAVLHAMHYHQFTVSERQQQILQQPVTAIDDLLTLPLLENPLAPDSRAVQQELDANVQSILGYVVRWIDQGIGCSKVPDIHGIGLMEDRATLRISSQHIANWLLHGICNKEQVMETLKRIAGIVDEQNVDDNDYQKMSQDIANNFAFQAARDLIFNGVDSPNGYTEPLLHAMRLKRKQASK